MMEQDRAARRLPATFAVEAVTMSDGRTIRYYTWPAEAAAEAEAGTDPAVAPDGNPDAADAPGAPGAPGAHDRHV